VRTALANSAGDEESTAMATPNAIDGEVASEEAWKPLSFGEGPRVGILGDSGCGKTEAQRRLIAGYLKRSPGCVLIVDDKENKPQFDGQCRRDRADLIAHPVTPEPRVIVFRGDRFDRETGEVDPEEIAEIQWRMAQDGHPSLVVYDELDKACNGGQWRVGDKKSAILWALRRGRSSGAATLWGTQETQSVPAAAFNQSSSIFCFRLVGAPLRLLDARGYLEGGQVADVIPTLPGDELDKAKRGYFVHLRRGRPWDGKIYRYGAKAPASRAPSPPPATESPFVERPGGVQVPKNG
jgi:energy-coupling factor transporter ATP-binding protein EcfA2